VVDEVHRLARAAGLEVLTGVHNQRLLMIVGGRFRSDSDAEPTAGGADGAAGGGAARGAGGSSAPAADPARGATPAAAQAGDADGAPGAAMATATAVAAATGASDRPRRAGGSSSGRRSDAAISSALDAAGALMGACGAGPVIVGPGAADLAGAAESARAALAAADVVAAWPTAPRPVTARALLPERALAGEAAARRTLIDEVYIPLRDAGAPLLATAGTYLDFGASLENTARALYLHPNTVRYRLRKASEVCGLDTADHRQRFTLHIALLLGRLDGA
jgi:hypothetical protein